MVINMPSRFQKSREKDDINEDLTIKPEEVKRQRKKTREGKIEGRKIREEEKWARREGEGGRKKVIRK